MSKVKMKELDLGRLREKLEQLKNPGAGRNKRPLWKPSEDHESTIRVIQYPHGDDPFVELWFHYRVGSGENSNFLCPRGSFGKDCPACELARKLWNSDEATDKDLARQLFAKQRIYAAIIDRADETPKPLLWGFGKRVYETVLGYFENEDYVNFLDLYEGLDLVVKYEKKPDQKFPTTTLTPRRKESRLAKTDKEIREIIDKIPNIEEVYQPITKSQILGQLNSWMDPDGSNPEGASSETKKGGTSSSEEAEKEVGGQTVDDVDAAFEEALEGI